MSNQSHTLFQDADKIVDEVLAKVGHVVNLTTPLAIGKANHLINAFYQRAKSDRSIQLNIMTALTLERPKGHSLLEKRFLEPFVERVFGDYPDLDYELDRNRDALPANIRVYEFYFPPGKFLANARAQQDYISSNYTHVVRDLMDRKANVVVQLISPPENRDGATFSLGANPDVAVDLISAMQQRYQKDGTPFAIVGQINTNLPYMFGDAEVRAGTFDYILDNPALYFRLFSTPKLSVPESDHMVGLYLSTLIRDEGELQVGIGAMGDALVNALLLRHRDNQTYQEVLRAMDVEGKFGEIINRLGDIAPFEAGLFGATEMVVDGFLHLYEAGILKRQVYDDLPLQRLLNAGLINGEVTATTLEHLLQRKAVHLHLSRQDFEYLLKFGVFREGLEFHEGIIRTPEGQEIRADLSREDNWNQVVEHCLGDRLRGGAVIHGGFFMGPQDFYQKLIAMPEQERRLISMRSVKRINHLYGHEEIDRLQRKNARFVNTCMKVTLAGHIVSDGLEDGRVVVYDFGCVKRVPEAIAAGYAALTRAAIEERPGDVPSILYELRVHKESGDALNQSVTDPYFDLLAGIYREHPPYTFGRDPEVYQKLFDLGVANLGEAVDLTFPEDIVFINRTLSGNFGNLSRLKATANWRSIAESHLPDRA